MILANKMIFGRKYVGDSFKMTINTALSPGLNFTVPVNYMYPAKTFSVNWGDGTITTGHTGFVDHTYSSAGIYNIEVAGGFGGLAFGFLGVNNDIGKKLIAVTDWGKTVWKNLVATFQDCPNLTALPFNAPNLAYVELEGSIFKNNIGSNFNVDITNWDISGFTSLDGLLYGCDNYTHNIDWTNSVTGSGNITNLTGAFLATKMASIKLDCKSVTETSLLTFFMQPYLTELILHQMSANFRIDQVPTVTGIKIDQLANSVKNMTGLISPEIIMSAAQKASCNLSLWTAKNWTII